MNNINEEFKVVSNLFENFNYILFEIHSIVKQLERNKLNESLGFFDLLEDEDPLIIRLNKLKQKLQELKKDIENHLNSLTRFLNEHIQVLKPNQVRFFNRSLIDIMIQNIQAEIEFEAIQKLSDKYLSSEEVGLNEIDIYKIKLNIAIQKLNKRSNMKMLLVSEARTEAWNEMKDIEWKYRKSN